MYSSSSQLHLDRLQQLLEKNGECTSLKIQAVLGISQASASRLLAQQTSSEEGLLVKLGVGRKTRYALAQPIGPYGALQPIWRIDLKGEPHRIGVLTFLARSQIHLAGPGIEQTYTSSPAAPLPWFLAPVRAEGFMGRLLARQLSAQGVASLSANPEVWDTQSVLIAATHMHDAPGSLILGSLAGEIATMKAPLVSSSSNAEKLDALAIDVAKSLTGGSSAGGEQPKFTAIGENGEHLIVKFSPPLGTPFGDRWNDLLCAEALTSEVLLRHGFAAAPARIVRSASRTYLLSTRFDRNTVAGRQHVVSVGAAHQGFVKGKYESWELTCFALAQQGRLSLSEADQVHRLLQFGRLIGNTDMHSGNASLLVQGETLAEILEGGFQLVPVYDMLPMRWKPEPMLGLQEYQAFEPNLTLVNQTVRGAAQDFWCCLAEHPDISDSMRKVSNAMSQRMGVNALSEGETPPVTSNTGDSP